MPFDIEVIIYVDDKAFSYIESLQYKALTQCNHSNKLQISLSQSIVDALKFLIKIMQVLISCRKLLPAEI